MKEHLKAWWASADRWDKKWTTGSVAFFMLSLLGWLFLTDSSLEIQQHLTTVGFNDPITLASEIASFSVKEVGWYVLFLGFAVSLIAVILSGWFSGSRFKLAAVLLGALLIADFSRANNPWIIHYNYKDKYDSNPVLDVLLAKPHENRVAGRLHPLSGQHLEDGQVPFSGMYESWLQHQFPYYNIQSLDIVQMPRMPQFDKIFLSAFVPANANQSASIGRLWQLTNTRYLLGMKSFLNVLNQQIDPIHRRFRVHTSFAFVEKNPIPGNTLARMEDITAVISPNGPLALFEFTGALPRAKLYTNWQTITNEQAALSSLLNPAFDPEKTVLLATPIQQPPSSAATNQISSGTVTIESYQPKQIHLQTQSDKPSVLLLNDRYHPDWTVYVDGKPGTVLRCNYAMRGVSLPPGKHSVEFRFSPRVTWLYVTLASVLVAIALCCLFAFSKIRARTKQPNPVDELTNPKS